jgi:hypothetical protein
MSHLKKISICQITLSPDADKVNFEEFMRTEVFPAMGVGQPTRGGMVTGQYLLKAAFPEPENSYSWIVKWEEIGGSPFGREGAPEVPVEKLKSLGASTSRQVFEVLAEDRWLP